MHIEKTFKQIWLVDGDNKYNLCELLSDLVERATPTKQTEANMTVNATINGEPIEVEVEALSEKPRKKTTKKTK